MKGWDEKKATSLFSPNNNKKKWRLEGILNKESESWLLKKGVREIKEIKREVGWDVEKKERKWWWRNRSWKEREGGREEESWDEIKKIRIDRTLTNLLLHVTSTHHELVLSLSLSSFYFPLSTHLSPSGYNQRTDNRVKRSDANVNEWLVFMITLETSLNHETTLSLSPSSPYNIPYWSISSRSIVTFTVHKTRHPRRISSLLIPKEQTNFPSLLLK